VAYARKPGPLGSSLDDTRPRRGPGRGGLEWRPAGAAPWKDRGSARLLAFAEGIATSPAKKRFPVPLQKARDQLRSQHHKRGQDTPFDPGPDGTTARFTQGRPTKPVIRHDHGFLDDGNGNRDEGRRRTATWDDHLAKAKWVAVLEGAELLRPDLIDATSAYRHFLFMRGMSRALAYDRFVTSDSHGKLVLASAIEDTRKGAITLHDERRACTAAPPAVDVFAMISQVVGVAADNRRYPYPATENWQKAIGAHSLWITADVTVTADPARGRRRFQVAMVVHMEDMYNFNPGNDDIETGIADEANGRFELTGLGHEFLNEGSLTRPLEFEEGLAPGPGSGPDTGPVKSGGPPRTSSPSGSRR
jgi:hypothetical protein